MEPAFIVDVAKWSEDFRAGAFPRPSMSPAHVVGEYSMDFDIGLLPRSKEHLRAYCKPPIGADLRAGLENDLPRVRGDVVLHILENPTECGVQLAEYDLLTGRLCLSMLAMALYNNQPFTLFARKTEQGPVDLWKGRDEARWSGPFARQAKHAGWMFEQVATERGKEGRRNAGKYYALVDRMLGDMRMIFCCEMDACNPQIASSSSSTSKFIELKALRKPTNERNLTAFHRNKSSRIWFQCFIAGIDRVVLGWYNDDCKLVRVEQSSTSSLHVKSMAYLKANTIARWNTNKMLAFLNFMLTSICQNCEAKRGRTLRLTFDTEERTLTAEFMPARKHSWKKTYIYRHIFKYLIPSSLALVIVVCAYSLGARSANTVL